ncbi:FtsH protease activity modulator HflK [Parashewanella spongiae]|uniref:Protein HflK n=1 Tax=Parashewanella spongiae TaxID=342950 RepID=A0A3A6U4F1_9GAMM|nr:FtsH protease activity modulator HflK [Parashewanella spongiae]MCL1077401.1 FtsH protease activity modulator HflK [Parashewanella spongiae]RJY18974.1 FtsH protease activity modulator HflK [Parashewanella spongiae]
MAWNEPGNKDKDPWGNKGRNGNDKGPPGLDEIFSDLTKRFGGKGKGSGSGSGSGKGSSFGGVAISIFVVIALIVWALSGVYTVKQAEKGVVLRFGEYVGLADPGIHWKATFVDEVYPVNVENVSSISSSGSMLTADENMVKVELEVQYKIADPYLYLFSAVDANASLREATDSALRYVIGHNKMDDILTTGREGIRQATTEEIKRILTPYKLGLKIEDVNLLPARPPEEVKDAFDDAIAAQEDEQRSILEAKAYARQVAPRARGQVERILKQAEAYKQRVVLEAKGKVARFEKLLPEYHSAPKVTRDRLYIETMEEVLAGSNKVLVDNKNSNNLMYLPLDKLMSNTPAMSNTKAMMPSSSDHQPSVTHSSNSGIPMTGRLSREERVREGRR